MRAYTLVETLVALFILSLLAIFVTGVFPQLHRSVELTRGHSQAAHLGRTLLEVARRTDSHTLASWSGSAAVAGEVAGRPSGLEFTYSVDVTEFEPGLKRVGAQVHWQTSSGSKQVDLQTEVVDPSIGGGTPGTSPGAASAPPGAPGQGTGGTPAPPSAGGNPGGTGLVNPTLPCPPFHWHDNGHHYGNPHKPDQHSHRGSH